MEPIIFLKGHIFLTLFFVVLRVQDEFSNGALYFFYKSHIPFGYFS
jgi:hypothetical protein